MAFGGLEAIDVSHEFHPQGLERLAQPFPGGEIAAQAARHENASKETASRQSRVQLLGPLFEQLALGLADLQRRGVAEMAEVVEVVVEAFEFCEQNAKRSSAKRRFAVGGALHRLAISERMCDASDPGDPLRHDDRLIGRTSFEARLHAAVLEEEPRLVVDDVLADIKEHEFRGFDDIGANRSERQLLDVFGFDARQVAFAPCRRAVQDNCAPLAGGDAPSCRTSG